MSGCSGAISAGRLDRRLGSVRLAVCQCPRQTEMRRHPARVGLERGLIAGYGVGRLMAGEQQITPGCLDVGTRYVGHALERVVGQQGFADAARRPGQPQVIIGTRELPDGRQWLEPASGLVASDLPQFEQPQLERGLAEGIGLGERRESRACLGLTADEKVHEGRGQIGFRPGYGRRSPTCRCQIAVPESHARVGHRARRPRVLRAGRHRRHDQARGHRRDAGGNPPSKEHLTHNDRTANSGRQSAVALP